MATTTSTADSGLLDTILPAFEQQYNAKVEVVAVGTGQAIALGENGDADVILVHARSREDAFVEAGHGTKRQDVMYNDFVVIGPSDDPAKIAGLSQAADAFAAINQAQAAFASRGDDSGTHSKEKIIWGNAGLEPTSALPWYKSLGQGMGDTLITANEMGAYTMADRGTFLAMEDKLPNLKILVGGQSIADNQDETLLNPYGVIPVNPNKNADINQDLAEKFAEWLTSADIQISIGEFGKENFGQPLFYPNSSVVKGE